MQCLFALLFCIGVMAHAEHFLSLPKVLGQLLGRGIGLKHDAAQLFLHIFLTMGAAVNAGFLAQQGIRKITAAAVSAVAAVNIWKQINNRIKLRFVVFSRKAYSKKIDQQTT